MFSSRRAFLAVGIALSLTGAAVAHHSGAAYDMSNQRSMEGTVKQVNWTNPHITFVIEADAKGGASAETWVFEASSPGVLTRSGWNKHSLQPGDHAVFHFAPLRNGSRGGFLLSVNLPSGQTLSFSLTPAEQQQ